MLTTSLRAERRWNNAALVLLTVLCTSGLPAAADDSRHAAPRSSNPPLRDQTSRMKIQLTVNGAVIATATLESNDSARDFAALLPLDLPLKDYAATEKIADLPRKLSTKGAPAASTPSVGDISFYAPWGNLAIFYKDGHLSSGLVRLGRLDAGLDVLRRPEPLTVRVERAAP